MVGRERRDTYPHRVASGDSHPDSVILWIWRPPPAEGEAKDLTLEIAEDSALQSSWVV